MHKPKIDINWTFVISLLMTLYCGYYCYCSIASPTILCSAILCMKPSQGSSVFVVQNLKVVIRLLIVYKEDVRQVYYTDLTTRWRSPQRKEISIAVLERPVHCEPHYQFSSQTDLLWQRVNFQENHFKSFKCKRDLASTHLLLNEIWSSW